MSETARAKIINFAEAKAKTTPTKTEESAVDFDAFLAGQGLDRRRLGAAYLAAVTDEEKQAPDVASCREDIAAVRKLRAMKLKMLDMLQADIDRYIKIERDLEESLLIEQYNVVYQLGSAGTGGDVAESPKPVASERRLLGSDQPPRFRR